MIVDCVSDLHGHFPKLDGGDLLIIAGDLTKTDRKDEYEAFDAWLRDQQYRKKVVIAGNHDNHLQNGYKIKYGDYLQDSGIEFDGFKIWGSPWTKQFDHQNPKCMAFALETEQELANKWILIPNDITILVTHSPPYGILDLINDNPITEWGQNPIKNHVGSSSLAAYIDLVKAPPKLWIFGHIHEGYGREEVIAGNIFRNGVHKIQALNASHVNERYEPINPPIRVLL